MSASCSVAIVHDYLSQFGGAERVVLHLAELFPEAPVYTSFYAPERTYAEFRGLDVRTSDLQGKIEPDRFRHAALRYPGAFRRMDLSTFDVVIVSTSGFAHHVRHPNSFVYCHTPPHFLYETGDYYRSSLVRKAAWPALAYLRGLDRRSAARQHCYIANSRTTAARIAAAYGRRAPVVYPPLWTRHLPERVDNGQRELRALVVARLLPYKRVDVAVLACRRAGIPLTVVGRGPEEPRLRALADSTVAFVGSVGDDELRRLFGSHAILLSPGREDFGYGPVEANYAGMGVVALRAGGALETVREGVTGTLVDGHDPGVWAEAIRHTLKHAWSPAALRAATVPFRARSFDDALTMLIRKETGQ